MVWSLPASSPWRPAAALSSLWASAVLLAPEVLRAPSGHRPPRHRCFPQLLKLTFGHFQRMPPWSSRLYHVPNRPPFYFFHTTIQLPVLILTWVSNVIFVFEVMSLVLPTPMASWRMRPGLFFAYQNKTWWLLHTRHSVNTCWIHGRFHFLFSSIIHKFTAVKAKNKNKIKIDWLAWRSPCHKLPRRTSVASTMISFRAERVRWRI